MKITKTFTTLGSEDNGIDLLKKCSDEGGAVNKFQ